MTVSLVAERRASGTRATDETVNESIADDEAGRVAARIVFEP